MRNHHKEMKLNYDRILSMYDDVSETALADAIRSVVDKSNTVYMFRRLNDDEPDTVLVTWVKSNSVASYDKVSIVSLTETENIIAASGEPIYRIDLDEINSANFWQKYKIPICGLKGTNATTGLYDFYLQDPLCIDDKAYEQHDFIFCNNDKALLVSCVCVFDFTFFDHYEIKKDYSNKVELCFDYRFDMHNKVSDANYSNVIRNIIDKSNIVYMFRRLNHGGPDTALVTWVKTNAVASYDLICLKSSTETINILAESEEPIYRIDLDGVTRDSFLQKYRIPISALKSSNMITGLYDFFIKDPLFIDDVTYDEYDFIFCDNEKALLMSFTHVFDFTIFHHGKIALKDNYKELELRFNNCHDIPYEFGLEDFPNLIRNIIDKSNIVYMFRKFSDGEPDTVLATWVKSNAVDSYDKISLISSIGTKIVAAEPEEPIYRIDLNGAIRDGFLQKYKMPISALRNSNVRDGVYDFFIKDPLFIDDITYAQYDFIFCDNENVLLSSFTHLFHFENFHVCTYFSF